MEWHLVEVQPGTTGVYRLVVELEAAVSVETHGEDRSSGLRATTAHLSDESDALKGLILALPGRPSGALDPGRFGLPMLAQPPAEILASATFLLPTSDNTGIVDDVWIQVWAAARRQGIGAALLHEVTRIAEDRRRDHVVMWSEHHGTEPAEGVRPASGAGVVPLDAGTRFAQRFGYRLAQVERQSLVRLPIATDRLERLCRHAQTVAVPAGYRVRSWVGPTPAELRPAMAVLLEALSADAPYGDIPWEPQAWDEERVVREEERELGHGDFVTTVALHSVTDEPAALTQIQVSREHPARPEQWATVVMASHRGHRLGLWVKAVNHTLLADQFPQARDVVTWNADENQYMLAINTDLGFEPWAVSGAWHRRIGHGEPRPVMPADQS